MDFRVSVNLRMNTLTANIDNKHTESGDRFYYYLLLEGKPEQRVGWIENNTSSWIVSKSGIYSVRAHIKRGGINMNKTSNSIFYATESDRNEFATYINDKGFLGKETSLKYYRSKYPYNDFAILTSSSSFLVEQMIFRDTPLQEFHFKILENSGLGKTCIISSEDFVKADKIIGCFSGITRNKDKLIYGAREFAPFISEISEDNCIGNFTVLLANENEITLTTDYFGVSKFYYYNKNGVFAASNRYHLLLLLLKALRLNLNFNVNKVIAGLASPQLQPFYQNFSREMDVSDVYVMPIHNFISISNGGVRFNNTSILEELLNSNNLDNQDYGDLLGKARDEIVDNVRVVLEHPNFEHVLVDVTGGMDSRMVFAAATNFPKYKSKIKICSLETASSKTELDVAVGLNNIYGFDYDDIPTNLELYKNGEVAGKISSYYLGTYYSYNPPTQTMCMKNTIRLSGMYGEIVARPYYSRRFLNTDLDVDKLDDFVEMYISQYQSTSLFPSESPAVMSLKSLFARELQDIPGRSPLEKFDIHYLYYRCGLHCSDVWRTEVSAPEWGPLQSKTLFKLKMLTFQKFKNIKLQLDMLQILSPILADLPYESENDNRDRELLKSSLYNWEGGSNHGHTELNTDRSKWIAAKKKKIANRTIINHPKVSPGDQLKSEKETINFFVKRILSHFDNPLVENIGMPIWVSSKRRAKLNTMDTRTRCLYNKITSLYYQSLIIGHS